MPYFVTSYKKVDLLHIILAHNHHPVYPLPQNLPRNLKFPGSVASEHPYSKKGADRYQTAAEMAADLRKALDNPDGSFIKQKKPDKRSKPRKRQETRSRKEAKAVDARQRRAEYEKWTQLPQNLISRPRRQPGAGDRRNKA
jgi:hypothetical protein